jgi:hypothetical protein
MLLGCCCCWPLLGEPPTHNGYIINAGGDESEWEAQAKKTQKAPAASELPIKMSILPVQNVYFLKGSLLI